MRVPPTPKTAVRDYWNADPCGTVYAQGSDAADREDAHAAARYELEPYLVQFARFPEGRDKDVLEVGVGLGADHLEWARHAPRSLTGIDLTPAAVESTSARLERRGFRSDLRVADAEDLPFPDASFDLVYSWGVMHHSPDTPRAVAEAARVLRSGGTARVMIYHRRSLVGLMLWTRYALMRGRPWRSLDDVYAHHLESPGTKAYSVRDAETMFREVGFAEVHAWSQLSHGDLIEGAVGQRHRGALLSLARRLWPRGLIRRLLPSWGLFLMIEARRR